MARADQAVDVLPLEDQGEPDVDTYDDVVPQEDSVPKDIDTPEEPQQADEPAESPLVLVKESAPVADEMIDVDQEMDDGEFLSARIFLLSFLSKLHLESNLC